MELKPALRDYTATEFLALVKRIWAVDLPKPDHDRLINHFDRISGHPQGSDLLFYSDEESISNSPELVVRQVRDWHQKQGTQGFREDAGNILRPSIPMSPLARSLAEVQILAAEVADSEQAVERAFGAFELGIRNARNHQNALLSITQQESNIRALEHVQLETSKAVRKLESWKVRIESAKIRANNGVTFAQSERAQWQSIAQQVNATQAHYVPRLEVTSSRHHALYDDAETLLIEAQAQLNRARRLAKAAPALGVYELTGSTTFADRRPDILLPGEPPALLLQQRIDLQKAIRSAVADLTWRNTSGEPSDENQSAAVLSFAFTSRADVQVFGMSVPLAEMVAVDGRDWHSLAATRSEVEVPFRLAVSVLPAKTEAMYRWRREGKDLVQVHINARRLRFSSARVQVRAAQHDLQRNTLSFTADGTAPFTVNWMLPVSLEASVPGAPAPSTRVGLAYSLPVPTFGSVIDQSESERIEDYIVVFPAGTGLDPLYVMLRNPIEQPG
ncbi:bacteriocin immunity protein [Pseudomonas vancouverensis]|uniref:bacteriocin immunity protein n=1 Tax=Pseudomonas vancouverensis TaxID=95300 RepID=UPI003D01E90E